MKFQGVLLYEQGVRFAIIIVRLEAMNNAAEETRIREFGTRVFGPIPIVLMAQDAMGTPIYSGRSDLVKFLAKVPVRNIPWREYEVETAVKK
ncbi:MAG: hypothetical protein IKC03_00495 [Oscillospiraceae bacterium]|nr:hypothetical protein [Oscillospiraceae bacterium]